MALALAAEHVILAKPGVKAAPALFAMLVIFLAAIEYLGAVGATSVAGALMLVFTTDGYTAVLVALVLSHKSSTVFTSLQSFYNT